MHAVLLSRERVLPRNPLDYYGGWLVTAQRTLDEYLGVIRPSKTDKLKTVQHSLSMYHVINDIRDLALCLHPDPRPRSVLVCSSLENARSEAGDCSSGNNCLELEPEKAAEFLCKVGYISASTVILLLDQANIDDKWWRLLIFWTIRSIPRHTCIVLVLPDLVKLIEEAGGEKSLPIKPPTKWSWLVTLISRKMGVCWEAFV